MPAGTPKVTMFGGKVIVPGGCQTFNAPGNFTVPVGVTKINLVGKGATGSPGAAGNAGGRGAGGTGGRSNFNGGAGGAAGGAGNTGAAGSAGAASTGFSKTFPGGSGGNGGSGGSQGSSGISGNQCYFNSIVTNPSNLIYPVSSTNSIWRDGGLTPTAPGGGGRGGKRSCSFVYCITWITGGGGGGGAGLCNAGDSPLNNINTFPCQFNNPTAPGSPGAGGNPGGGAGGNSMTQIQPGCSSPRAGTPGSAANVSGAGGGGAGGCWQTVGGAGGGRGNAGNAGSPGNPGSAANPTSFNCVSVCPGGSYPLTVNGQIVVSWNPQ